MLEYRIAKKAPFTIVGMRRRIHSERSYEEIPRFWEQWKTDPQGLTGIFGICMDMDEKELDYWIADNYVPWKDVPAGQETLVIQGGLWAQFRCTGPLPGSLQSVNTQIFTQWLPTLKGYALAGSYSVEVYGPPRENPEETESFIWIPLKKTE